MAQQIPAAAILAEMKELNLFSKSWVGNSQVSAVAEALRSNSSLTFIGFRECRAVDDVGVVALASALGENSSLRKLSLESTKVGDRGATALAEAVPQSGLARLDLGYSSVGDRGAAALARAISEESSQLTTLHLDYCTGITDAGADALLSAAVENPRCKLTTLGLKGTSISAAMRARLDQAFGARRRGAAMIPPRRGESVLKMGSHRNIIANDFTGALVPRSSNKISGESSTVVVYPRDKAPIASMNNLREPSHLLAAAEGGAETRERRFIRSSSKRGAGI